jgi:hypothetical protein
MAFFGTMQPKASGASRLRGINVDRTEVRVAVPAEPIGPMWFDELIRLPDYFAGTIAAWNTPANTLPEQPKSLLFAQMLEHVIADASNMVVLKLNIGGDGLQWRRIAVQLNHEHIKIPLGP